MKRLLFVLAIAMLLVACGSKNDANNEAVPVEEKVYTVGDTVEINDLTIKLNDANFTETEGKKNPENEKVITLDVTVTNEEREDDLLVDNLHFNLTNADDEKMDIYYGYDESDIHGVLATGESLDGKLFFDVDESEYYQLTYKPATKENKVTLTFKIEM